MLSLHEAARVGDIEKVKELISEENINAKDESGHTPLYHVIIGMNDVEMGNDFNEDVANEEDRYILFASYLKKQIASRMAIIDELISAGADVNVSGEYGTPLITAATFDQADLAAKLLDSGAQFEVLCFAAIPLASNLVNEIETYKEKIEQSIEQHEKVTLDICFPCTITDELLLWASEKGYSDVVNSLINLGTNVNFSKGKNNALSKAVINNHIEVAQLLIKAGASPLLSRAVEDPIFHDYGKSSQEHFDFIKSFYELGYRLFPHELNSLRDQYKKLTNEQDRQRLAEVIKIFTSEQKVPSLLNLCKDFVVTNLTYKDSVLTFFSKNIEPQHIDVLADRLDISEEETPPESQNLQM